MHTNDCTESFLSLAPEHWRRRCEEALGAAGGQWAALQRTFLDWVDEYAKEEASRAPDYAIDSHEAGGAWRLVFPHLRVRPDAGILAHMAAVMIARRNYADLAQFHGFADEAEVHHEIETFLYFQMPLWFLADCPVAEESIEDLAHHVGNWVAPVPAWYDWASHGFVSTYLGTRGVRNRPPYDYQEANHWRFVAAALAAHCRSHEPRYLALAADYAARWCEHIESAAAAGGPIPCQILPPGAATEEMGHAGANTTQGRYQIFYSIAAVNTAYDIFCGLTDVYRLTHDERCLRAATAMLDQFFDHGQGGRPAVAFKEGHWQAPPTQCSGEPKPEAMIQQWPALLVRMALRHDLLTGQGRYARAILDWAAVVDEHACGPEQMMPDVMIAAHFYSGQVSWLARAYEMALRTWAVTNDDAQFAMCSAVTRGGAKMMMETLYMPLLASSDWGTRGGLPLPSLTHRGGLPRPAAFRTWRGDGATLYEALNAGDQPVQWRVESAASPGIDIALPAYGIATGKIAEKGDRLL